MDGDNPYLTKEQALASLREALKEHLGVDDETLDMMHELEGDTFWFKDQYEKRMFAINLDLGHWMEETIKWAAKGMCELMTEVM